MQPLLSIALAVYLSFYVFEGVIRYGFNLVGADELIFIRDAVLILSLLVLLAQQFHRRYVHPAFLLYIWLIVIHGTVMILNIGSTMAVIYSAKVLLSFLFGAMAAPTLVNPGRKLLLFVLLLWAVSWTAVLLDKYYVEMPWVGLGTNIGGVEVEISRDWQISGEDKRAAGLMRSSISVATVMPLLALMLLVHLRSLPLRLFVAFMTIPCLYWTTQKGPIIAYLLTLGIMALAPRKPITPMKIGVLFTMALMIGLPVILPDFTMPSAQGVFSFSSFYMRIEQMWPHAWRWIDAHEAFPFGVGLGGISGAQRLYAPNEVNAADNLFILLYAFFGVMSFVYLGAIAFIAILTRSDASKSAVHSMAILVFLLGYGCVISLLEDQMALLFLGASLAWLCHELKLQKTPALPQPQTAAS